MRRRYHVLGALAGAATIVAFAWYATTTLDGRDLSRHLEPRGLVAISVAAIFYATIIPISAWAWQRLMAAMGVHRTWVELAMIMGLTQLAKYIPGNVAYHLGRGGMATARGIGSRPLVSSMLVETLLSVFSALVVGVAGALLSSSGLDMIAAQAPKLTIAVVVVACAVSGVALLNWLLPAFIERFAPSHRAQGGDELLPDLRAMLFASGCYVANFAVIGVGVWAMARILLPETSHDALLLGAAFAVSWVAGFFTPGAPAGLGIREGLLLLMLSPAYAAGDALAIVIALRLATMLGDVLCFGGGYVLLVRGRSARPGWPRT